MTEPDIVEVVYEGDPCLRFEEPAEGGVSAISTSSAASASRMVRPKFSLMKSTTFSTRWLSFVDQFGIVGDVVTEGTGIRREGEIV